MIFSSGQEIVTLNHESFDRAIYSEGALEAAKWISNKKPGLYSNERSFKILVNKTENPESLLQSK